MLLSLLTLILVFTCDLVRITLARFLWGSSHQVNTQNSCAFFGYFCFYTLINMNVEHCKNKKTRHLRAGFLLVTLSGFKPETF